MPRKVISFDCDGVLAEGAYTPVEDRNNKVYIKKQVAHPDVIPSLQWLSIMFDIFIISTRSHDDANLGLRAWLHFVMGLELDTIAGVITFPTTTVITKPDHMMDKAGIVRAIGSVVHFDDHPEHVRAMPEVGVLFPSEWDISQAAVNLLPTASDWTVVREFLTTPGYTLYGSEGGKVVSPAELGGRQPLRFDTMLVDPLGMKELV